MLYSVKFYRFDIVGIFIFRVRRFAGLPGKGDIFY